YGMRDYGTLAVPREALKAAGQFADYFAERLAGPRGSIDEAGTLAFLQRAENEGCRLTLEEQVGVAMLIYAAGTETTAGFMSSLLLALDANRDQWDDLVSNPELIPDAVEELLRFDSPAQTLARTCVSDVTLHGKTIPAGSRVIIL